MTSLIRLAKTAIFKATVFKLLHYATVELGVQETSSNSCGERILSFYHYEKTGRREYIYQPTKFVSFDAKVSKVWHHTGPSKEETIDEAIKRNVTVY